MSDTHFLNAMNCKKTVANGLAYSQGLALLRYSMWQEDLVSIDTFINECLDTSMLQQLAHLMIAWHLIGPMWQDEM